MSENAKETWESGAAYEQYVGRWSRRVAAEFVRWLAPPGGGAWADVGCGTGGLTATILQQCDPAAVTGIDRSEGFLAEARRRIPDGQATFRSGDATALPLEDSACDAAVSGLVLNFVTEPDAMAREMARVTKAGGTVAAYVWDYAEGMEMMRHFWDAVIEVSPGDAHLDEGPRFPVCDPDALATLWGHTGLTEVSARAIDIATVFRDFDDYWTPFLGGQGPGPTYVAAASAGTRERIRSLLKARLVPGADGRIALRARAWAVRGRVAPGAAF